MKQLLPKDILDKIFKYMDDSKMVMLCYLRLPHYIIRIIGKRLVTLNYTIILLQNIII